MNIILGNIICGAGAVLMIIAGMLKKREKILILQCAQFGVMGIGNLVLGGISGALSNAFSIVRNLYSLKFKLHWWMGCIFVAAQAALTIFMDEHGWLGWLPVIATAIFTFVINAKNENVLKAAVIAGQVCWAVYDIFLQNYVTFAFDILTIVSNFAGILLSLRKKHNDKEEQ